LGDNTYNSGEKTRRREKTRDLAGWEVHDIVKGGTERNKGGNVKGRPMDRPKRKIILKRGKLKVRGESRDKGRLDG